MNAALQLVIAMALGAIAMDVLISIFRKKG